MNVINKKSHRAKQVIMFLTYERGEKRIPVGRTGKGLKPKSIPSSLIAHLMSTRGKNVANWGYPFNTIAKDYKNVRVERTVIDHDNPVRRFLY